jgi:sugar lactone lactonase YvrE
MKFKARILTCAMTVLIVSAMRLSGADARLIRSQFASAIPSARLAAKLAKSARLRMKPAELAFGRVQVGATGKSLPLTLSNIGGAPLQIGSISTSSNQFKVANQCGSELAGSGDSCGVTVTFAPTSDKRNKATHVHGILDITETNGRIHKVLLSGVAFGPDDPPTPTPVPSSKPTPDPLVHAILVTNSNCNTVTSYPIGAAGNAAPTFGQTGLCTPFGIAVDSTNNVYITNVGTNDGYSSVTEYAAGSNGDTPPLNTIVGPHTGLDRPTGVAVSGGKIYVTNYGSYHGDVDSVTIYAAGVNGDTAPIATISGSNTRLSAPARVAVDVNGNIYVTNPPDNTVTIYAPGSSGNVAPSNIISGFDTRLDFPVGLALDANANVYVANFDENNGSSIVEYAAGSTGDATPIAVVTEGLLSPFGIAVDGSGKLYVADVDNMSVDIYTPGEHGAFSLSASQQASVPVAVALDTNANVYVVEQGDALAVVDQENDLNLPDLDAYLVFEGGTNLSTVLETVSGPSVNLGQPTGIALDGSGNIYVASPEIFSINIYPSGSGAAVAPSNTISPDVIPFGLAFDGKGNLYATDTQDNEVSVMEPGDFAQIASLTNDQTTQLDQPAGIALDGNGNIYIANQASDAITIYPAESSGSVAPSVVISGANTGLAFPSGIVLDGNGNIYVSNKANDSITVYAAGSNGNVAPMATISGSNTGLDTPSAIALDSTGIIYVANEGGFEGNNASVTVYPAGSNGNVLPGLTIGGTVTQLARPQGIAVLP